MISLGYLVGLALAAYYATYLAVHATLFDGLRDPVFAWHGRRPTSRLRTAAVTLLSCTYCMSAWMAAATVATYLLTTGTWHQAPLLVHGLEWLAVAAGSALAARWDDTRDTETSTTGPAQWDDDTRGSETP